MLREKNEPTDCVRLLDIILHNLGEMETTDIQLLDVDENFQQDVDDQVFVCVQSCSMPLLGACT